MTEHQTDQWQVLSGHLVKAVRQIFIETGKILHLHFHPKFSQCVMSLELISAYK